VVVVMPSEALAKAEIATLGSRSGRRCLAHGLRLSGPLGSGPARPKRRSEDLAWGESTRPTCYAAWGEWLSLIGPQRPA
jgi:hypothetical protein